MAGSTEFFGMAFFDYGDELDAPLNVQKEVERFVLIDRQLYGMFNVFGNGVINGWNVTTNGSLQVTISTGVGIINSFAVESDFTDTLSNIPANTTGYVYAIIDNSTVTDRLINFVYSITPILSDSLILAQIVSGPSAIISIDTSVRTLIGFKQIITDLIATTRHNGIDAPKIDLTQEVQGLLPMDHIGPIDASKITGSKLASNVIGPIDHTTLKNIGTMSHVQLDTFVQSIQKDNIALFGEITTINLLKLICRMKYLDTTVDEFFENELVIIPGISPDSYIDWEHTNANVSKETHCISGLPTLVGGISAGGQGTDPTVTSNLEIITVPWVTDADFNLASSITNLAISNGVKLSVDTTNARVIESFDTGIIGQTISTYVGTLVEADTTKAYYDQPAAQGPLAGTFSTANTRSMKFIRTFPQTQDWTSYDTLNIYVKSTAAAHAAVTMLVLDANGNQLATYLLLGTDEVTSNTDTNGFALKQFSIAGFVRNAIASIEFVTDTITNQTESFSLDTIYLTSQTYLLPQGNMRLRYNTNSAVIFNSVEYYGTFPTGTSFRIRVRVADSLQDLANATFTPLLSSGQAFSLSGSYIEIDITLLSDATFTLTPLLQSIYLTILVPATQSGLTITSASDWAQGVTQNISVSNAGVVDMTEVNVGDIYFINQIYVNELDTNLLPDAGVTADNLPIAPYQGYAALNASAQVADPNNPGREFLRGLYNPKSVYRLDGGNFLIADTGNDRILEMTSDGLFVRGFASHNNVYDTELYALTSNYNTRIGVLFITFSMQIDIRFFDLTKVIMNVGGQDIQLSNAVDEIRDPTTGAIIDRPDLTAFLDGSSGNYNGQLDTLVSIILSADKQSLLATNTAASVTVRIIGNPSPAVNAVVPNYPTGLECFMGDYMYFGRYGIWNPITAIDTAEDRYLIANGTVNESSQYLATSGIASIIEFEKAIGSTFDGTSLGSTFTYSTMVFSDIMLGSVVYYEIPNGDGTNERMLLIAGLTFSSSASGSSSSAAGSTTQANGQTFLGATDAIKLSNFVGQIITLSMDSGLISFQYTSPDGMYPSDAYFNDDGNIVAAESSLTVQSGRIITLDASANIIKLIGNGLYTKIWDVRNQPNGHIFVST